MLEDADFSKIETKIITVRIDTLRKVGVECKGSPVDELKRIGDKKYYDEKKVRHSSDGCRYDDSCGVWAE